MCENEMSRDAYYQPGQTALLLVDMQRKWLAEPYGGGEATAEDYFQKWTSTVSIPNSARLLEAARASKVEVVHTITQSLTRDGRDRSLDHKLSGMHLAPGDEEARIIDQLTPDGDEIVIKKTSSGVFNSTNIDYVLRNLGVKYLVIAGVLTDQCVDMAVRDAADKGYYVTCVSDACAAPTQSRHEGALRAFGGYCWTADTMTVVQRFYRLDNHRE